MAADCLFTAVEERTLWASQGAADATSAGLRPPLVSQSNQPWPQPKARHPWMRFFGKKLLFKSGWINAFS